MRALPLPKERVWGGSRLGPPAALPIGELWVASPWNVVAGGTFSGRSLEEVAGELGADLVGSAGMGRPPGQPGFPLLVKLLDPAAWLSVQVHPDDDDARALAGEGAVGKTEAWYVVEADPGAELLAGVRAGVSDGAVRAAIREGAATTALLERRTVRPGDALLLPAGTLHAVGPGLLLYELQQPSDLTYRVDDWGRPATPGRPLHTAESLVAVRAAIHPEPARAPGRLATCPHFMLDAFDDRTDLDPGGRTLHVVTAIGGRVHLAGSGWDERLDPLGTVVVPATAGPYALEPAPGARALVAALP